MRSNVDNQKIEQFMKVVGNEAKSSGCIYFTGGVSALLMGWRCSTIDIDIRFDPESSGIFQAIAPELIRFPSLNPDLLKSKVENLIKHIEDKGLEVK